MEKANLIKRLNRASRRFLLGLAMVLISAPFSIVPLLRLLGVNQRPEEYPAWLWEVTPIVPRSGFGANGTARNELFLIAGCVVLVVGVYMAYTSHKEWDKLEKIRSDADKKLLIDDYAQKKTSGKK